MHIPQTLANFAHLLAAAAASHSIQLSPDPQFRLIIISSSFQLYSVEKKKKKM